MFSNVLDYRTAAKRYLPAFAYHYLEGGAEDGLTMTRNRALFQRVMFSPKVMVDVSRVVTAAEVSGASLDWPVIVGPTGLNGLYRYQADESLARAAKHAGVPFVVSTASTSLLESVRDASDGELWLQLYVQRDRRIAENMMVRARECRFSTLLLTVDTPVAGQRDHYHRTGFTLPLRWSPTLLWDVITHPAWVREVGRRGVPQMVNLAESMGMTPDIVEQSAAMNQAMDTSLSWDDIRWVRRHWPGRVVIKGIQRVSDAQHAQALGADGVVLSNHGGRQLDGAPGALEILARVVASTATNTGQGFDVFLDGGIRRGSDIVKALSFGAKAVLLGRAPLYGLAARGDAGVAEVLSILRRELEICLRLVGCPDIKDLSTDYLCGPGGVRWRDDHWAL